MQADVLSTIFRSRLPKIEKTEFIVTFSALGEKDAPAVVTQNEFMRRMKEMSAMQPGLAGFYGEMPSTYTLQVNTLNPVVKRITDLASSSLDERIAPIRAQVDLLNKEIEEEQKKQKENGDKKADDVADEEREKKIAELRGRQDDLVSKYAQEQPAVRMIIDLALLRAGMLSGEELDGFIRGCYAELEK